MRILEATEGNFLTQSKDVPVLARILSKKVYLAVNDSVVNWKEITSIQAEEYIRLSKEERERQMLLESEQSVL